MRGTSCAFLGADNFNVRFPTPTNMRNIAGNFYYAAWYACDALAIAARKALRLLSAARTKRRSPPDSGLSGAGVLAPLLPRPPLLFASIAKQLPQSNCDET